MARNFSTRPLAVTGVLRTTGELVPGLVVTSAQDVRDFLLPGERLTDGAVVESGWSELWCSECGENSLWCLDLGAALPATTLRHVDGLVSFGG